MKVLLLASGANIHTARWVEGLSSAGVTVILATQHQDLLSIPSATKIHRLPFSGGSGYLLNGPALRRIWKLERPDLLNVHYASGYGTTARMSRVAPVLLSVWGSDVYEFPNRSLLHRWWLRGNLAAANHIASTSRAMAEQVRRMTPERVDISITPFGVDMDLFEPPRRTARNDTIVIGTVKALKPIYGVDILIESFAHLRAELLAEDPDLAARLRLRIVGDGPERQPLEELVNVRNIDSVTEFLPKVPHAQVPKALSGLDIYAALSRHESFGVAILEAGACELPVVVSNAGGLPEVVRDEKTGLVVPRGNPGAATRALKRLVLDVNLRRSMGSAARIHVERHYAWSSSIERMIAVYEEMQRSSAKSTRMT